jgi:hypothetical protein
MASVVSSGHADSTPSSCGLDLRAEVPNLSLITYFFLANFQYFMWLSRSQWLGHTIRPARVLRRLMQARTQRAERLVDARSTLPVRNMPLGGRRL